MDPRRSEARPSVPSWDEIMLRQRPAAGGTRDLPTAGGGGGDRGEEPTDDARERGRRPALGTITLDQLDGRARVEVELVHAGATVRGCARRATVAAAAADATALALSDLTAPFARFEVTAVDVSTERLVVELTVAGPDGAHRLVGAVAVDGRGRGGAAVRATLDAVNRPLSRWLAARSA